MKQNKKKSNKESKSEKKVPIGLKTQTKHGIIAVVFFVLEVFPVPFCSVFPYGIYSNYIEKIGLGITFSIDGSAKTERIRKTYGCISVCVQFFCGPIDLNGAKHHDLCSIGHVLSFA
jgi:hypothetical protein